MYKTMENSLLLSVVVITYNHEKYISQALDSVFSQKVSFDYEVLIGDDASTDNTSDILRCYKEKYPQIELFLREKNVGANYNVYELLSHSKGKYIAILDGDDFWCDDYKLQKQVMFLEKNPEFVASTNKIVVVDEDGNETFKEVEWIKNKDIFTIDDFDGFHLPGQTSSIVKRNFFIDQVHDMSVIYRNHSFLGDRFSVLIYLCEGNFKCIDSVMSAYRIHDQDYKQNLTYLLTKDSSTRIEDEYKITVVMEKYANDKNKTVCLDGYKKKLLADLIEIYFRNATVKNKELLIKIYKDISDKRFSLSYIWDVLAKRIGIRGFLLFYYRKTKLSEGD